MRTYDMTPLYRSTIGFDRLFNDLFDNVSKLDGGGYPPYNIELADENNYHITLAVAGFGDDDIEVEVTEQTLRVSGKRTDDEADRTYLHQGIAGRNFERRFQLADHVRVIGASLTNGLLNIELEREIPEAKKPRKIAINTLAKGVVLDGPGKILKATKTPLKKTKITLPGHTLVTLLSYNIVTGVFFAMSAHGLQALWAATTLYGFVEIARDGEETTPDVFYREAEVGDFWGPARQLKRCKLAYNKALSHTVSQKLQHKWSLDQIAGWLKRAHPQDKAHRVSHGTSYLIAMRKVFASKSRIPST